MTKAVSSIPVSIRPDSFTEPSISELTAGDVIRMYHTQESKRKRNDDEYGQSDVPISFRSVPEGLLEVLDEISSSIGVRKSIVTKCLSHHAMSWYQSLPQVALLSRIYKSLHTRSDGFPDITRKVKRDDYEFVHPRSTGTNIGVLRTVAFVLGYFGDIGNVLGIPAYKMFLTGLCWSVSTNTEGWSKNAVTKFLVPEGENIQAYLSERLLVLDYADKTVRLRQGDKQVIDYVKDMGNREW
jgi:hypothetical protein